jgi:hypothetical protein
MTRAADPLEENRERPRSPDLADEVDGPHVDPELERRGGDDCLDDSALELVLGTEAKRSGKTPMVREDGLLPQPFFELWATRSETGC